jgi:UDP-N-acetylmuramoyl-L-alanyl-D-glutamate--2,6-diaminopimelate ligase
VHAECVNLPLDLEAEAIEDSPSGTTVTIRSTTIDGLGGSLSLQTIGRAHTENALAAALASSAAGYHGSVIRRGLNSFPGVRGRFQIVASEPTIIIDRATSPHALLEAMMTARTLARNGKLHLVFGCNGDSDDNGARPEMGKIADRLSDVVVLTSANPRFEDPQEIADDVENALGAIRRAHWIRELDRTSAIRLCVSSAASRDVIVIAGRGNEPWQVVDGKLVALDDEAIATQEHERRSPSL